MTQNGASKNMRLLAHNDLGGFGNCGEGMAIQLARDGRRVLWLGHESAPKNFTAVDVTDPRKPSVILQTDLAHGEMRSNNLELLGDLLIVPYQTVKAGAKPAGVEFFDVSDPGKPKSIAFFDASGPHSRGVHHLWFVDGAYLHLASGAPDFKPRNPKDDQFYRIVDVRQPTKPVEVGRWWLPGTRDGDPEPPPTRHTTIDAGFRAHNTNVYPRRPDRACRLPRRGRDRARHLGHGPSAAREPVGLPSAVSRVHPHAAAALRPATHDRLRRSHRGGRQGLAEARVGRRRP